MDNSSAGYPTALIRVPRHQQPPGRLWQGAPLSRVGPLKIDPRPLDSGSRREAIALIRR
jgi:hypothetical protein